MHGHDDMAAIDLHVLDRPDGHAGIPHLPAGQQPVDRRIGDVQVIAAVKEAEGPEKADHPRQKDGAAQGQGPYFHFTDRFHRTKAPSGSSPVMNPRIRGLDEFLNSSGVPTAATLPSSSRATRSAAT